MHRGFTLVEVLIVLAVISVLSGIGIFSFSTVRNEAVDSQAKSMAASMTSALNRYYSNNNEYPLANDLFGGTNYGSPPTSYASAATVLGINQSNFATSAIVFAPCSINMSSTAPGSSCSYGYYGEMEVTNYVKYITKDAANTSDERSYIVQSPNGPNTAAEYCEVVFKSYAAARTSYVLTYFSRVENKVKFIKSANGDVEMFSPQSGQCVFTAL